MKINLEELKNIPILDIAERLNIRILKNKAMCFKGHDRKTPSLSFTPHKNLWHCFGCGAGGNNINLVMQCLQKDFKEACHWIQEQNNTTYSLPKSRVTGKNFFVNKKAANGSIQVPYAPDPEVYEWLIESSSLTALALNYLVKKRGFTQETIEHFRIKAIERPMELFTKATKIWGVERLSRCGLATSDDKGKFKFVWWSPILIFPFYDLTNRIQYLQGRQIGDSEPRYINLKGVKTEIFNLIILNSLSLGEYVYINEGITDVLAAHQFRLKAVGILGANGFKDEWAKRFMNYKIKIVPDADSAGEKFARQVKGAFRKIGKSVQILRLPQGVDFAEFLSGAKNE